MVDFSAAQYSRVFRLSATRCSLNKDHLKVVAYDELQYRIFEYYLVFSIEELRKCAVHQNYDR